MIHRQNFDCDGDWASFFVSCNFGFSHIDIDDDRLNNFEAICNKDHNNFVCHILELAISFMN